MRKTLLTVLLLVTGTAVFAIEPDKTTRCISVDPLIRQKVALTWWNGNRTKGSRLMLSGSLEGRYYEDIDRTGTVDIDRESTFALGEYDWSLKRWKVKSADSLYYYHGFGVLLGGSYSIGSYSQYSRYSANLGLTFPMGLEYFLIASAPNLCLAIEASPYVSISYGRSHSRYSTYNYSDSNSYSISIGITPQIFLSYYF